MGSRTLGYQVRVDYHFFVAVGGTGVVYSASLGYKYEAVKWAASVWSKYICRTSMPFALTTSMPNSLGPDTMVNSDPRGIVTDTVSSLS